MATLNIIIKRAMSLMNAHVQYSQSLAAEFADLIKDDEVLDETPAEIELDAQEEVDIEAVCGVFEELMKNEPIAVLRVLRSNGVAENTEEEVFGQEELVGYRTIRARRINRRHQKKVHSTKKNFKCKICRKKFCTKSSLNRHIIRHTGAKPFECAICSKRFERKSSLDVHSEIHTDGKPFECSICNKSFGYKQNLKVHTRIHKKDQSFNL